MSYIVGIIVNNLAGVDELNEVKAVWGGELFSTEPPRYVFREIELVAMPIPAYVRSHLTHGLQQAQLSLRIPDPILLDWAAGRWVREEHSMAALLLAVAREPEWAVWCDGTQSPEVELVECESTALYKQVAAHVTGRKHGLLVVTGTAGARGDPDRG